MKHEITFEDYRGVTINQETIEGERATAQRVIKMIERRGFLADGDCIRIKFIPRRKPKMRKE